MVLHSFNQWWGGGWGEKNHMRFHAIKFLNDQFQKFPIIEILLANIFTRNKSFPQMS